MRVFGLIQHPTSYALADDGRYVRRTICRRQHFPISQSIARSSEIRQFDSAVRRLFIDLPPKHADEDTDVTSIIDHGLDVGMDQKPPTAPQVKPHEIHPSKPLHRDQGKPAALTHATEIPYFPSLNWPHSFHNSRYPQQDYSLYLMLLERANKRWLKLSKEGDQEAPTATPLEEEEYVVLDKEFIERVAAMDSEYSLDRDDSPKRSELEGASEQGNGGEETRGGGICTPFASLHDTPVMNGGLTFVVDPSAALDNFDFDVFLNQPSNGEEIDNFEVDLAFGEDNNADEIGNLSQSP